MSVYTEEEAKTKWCPFVRLHGTPSDDCIPNRSGNFSDITRCLGSACMAWREQKGLFHLARNKFLEEGETYSSQDIVEWRSINKGYCGLAGKP